jgi:indolepyruvate ferredoxin oxidoreductase beta subunit
MVKTCCIYIVGVGGQGVGAASRVITSAAEAAGVPVRSVETHGLAQRGGVVVSTVRIGGAPDSSPLIAPGEADVLFALEPAEAARSSRYLRRGGVVLLNTSKIDPLWVRLEKQPYPPVEEIVAGFRGFAGRVIALDATAFAVERGSWISSNAVLLGALAASGALPFDGRFIEEGIKAQSGSSHLERNLACFRRGFEENPR